MALTKTMRVNRWGNSLGIRFPREIIDLIDITDKSLVDIKAEDGQIVIRKSVELKPHKSLQERFEGFEGEYEPITVEWGEPKGREIW